LYPSRSFVTDPGGAFWARAAGGRGGVVVRLLRRSDCVVCALIVSGP
jgi:hypothetical protein